MKSSLDSGKAPKKKTSAGAQDFTVEHALVRSHQLNFLGQYKSCVNFIYDNIESNRYNVHWKILVFPDHLLFQRKCALHEKEPLC